LFVTFLTLFIQEPVRGAFNNEAKNEEMQRIAEEQSPFWRRINECKVVISNPIFIFLLIGASLRFFGGYALGFWLAKFFVGKFPENKAAFAIIHSLSVVLIGVPSHYMAGHFSDKYADSKPQVKGLLACFSGLLAFPFLVIALVISQNFWISILSISLDHFPAGMWLGPTFVILQDIFPSEIVGTASAIFFFIGGISGAISNILLGTLSDHFNIDENPNIAGYLLVICTAISHLGSSPFYFITSQKYKKFIFNQKRRSSVISESVDLSE